MKKRILLFFKDNNGQSNSIGMLFATLLVAVLLVLLFNIATGININIKLQSFADQMATKSGEVGKCTGKELEDKYAHLEAVTGLSPVMEITSTNYIDASRKTVQYGEDITVTLTLDVKKLGNGIFAIPLNKSFTATKITQSEQYWK